MRPIPNKLRKQLSADPRMKTCAVSHLIKGDCTKKIEWHHVWIYAGRQINESWAILPACDKHHREVDTVPRVRNEFRRASLRLATHEDLAKYPDFGWNQTKRYLGV